MSPPPAASRRLACAGCEPCWTTSRPTTATRTGDRQSAGASARRLPPAISHPPSHVHHPRRLAVCPQDGRRRRERQQAGRQSPLTDGEERAPRRLHPPARCIRRRMIRPSRTRSARASPLASSASTTRTARCCAAPRRGRARPAAAPRRTPGRRTLLSRRSSRGRAASSSTAARRCVFRTCGRPLRSRGKALLMQCRRRRSRRRTLGRRA